MLSHNRAVHLTTLRELAEHPSRTDYCRDLPHLVQFASFLWSQAGDLSDGKYYAAYSDFPHHYPLVDQGIDEKEAHLVARDARDESVRLLAQLDDETLEWREIGRIPG